MKWIKGKDCVLILNCFLTLVLPPRPMLLPHPQDIRLLQPGLYHPNMDLGEPPPAVGWGSMMWGQLEARVLLTSAGQRGTEGDRVMPPVTASGTHSVKQHFDSWHSFRLLQLDGPPQSLAFSSNSGNLVFTLGSRLYMVSHKLYLPTSYLVKV